MRPDEASAVELGLVSSGSRLMGARRRWHTMKPPLRWFGHPFAMLRVFFAVLCAVIAALATAGMVTITHGLTQSYQHTLSVFTASAVLYFAETGYTNCYRMLASPTNATELQAGANGLADMILGLTKGLHAIEYGNTTFGLFSPTRSANITLALSRLEGPVNTTLAAIDVIRTSVLEQNATVLDPDVDEAIDVVLNQKTAVIFPLRRILTTMTVEALDLATAVQAQQYVVMSLILGSVILIAVLVYIPVERRLRHAASALVDKNEELSLLSDELAAMMQLSPNGIFRTDAKGHIVYANERWRQLTGLTAATQDTWLASVHPNDREELRLAWERALVEPPSGTPFVAQFRYVRGDETIWVLCHYRSDVVLGPASAFMVRALIGSFADVTQQKQLEQEKLEMLRRTAEQAERHRREQEMFVDTICHGIRNPLNGILNNVELLRAELQKRRTAQGHNPIFDDDEDMALVAIETCANYQRIITDDVLDFSRLKANTVSLHPAAFRVADLVQTSMIMYTAEARAEDISLVSDVSDDVARLVLVNDRERLSQILANLLSNAIKFTRSAIERKITLSAQVEPPLPGSEPTQSDQLVRLRLSVRDTGVGIASQDQPLLFHRFRQVGESARTYNGGSGLGLSICKLLLDLMGGQISVQSELGQGTEFTVTVPCQLGQLDPSASATSSLQWPLHEGNDEIGGENGGGDSIGGSVLFKAASPGPRRLRVLIVEDNLINQSVLRRQLEMSANGSSGISFDVSVANNGQEALDLMLLSGFDVVLMDIEMPVLNGIAATRNLRERGDATPIVGLSGNAREEQVEAAMSAGMQAYLIKPYNRKVLVATVARLCLSTGKS